MAYELSILFLSATSVKLSKPNILQAKKLVLNLIKHKSNHPQCVSALIPAVTEPPKLNRLKCANYHLNG